MSRYDELMAQAKALIDQAESARKIERDIAVMEIRARMAELGLTVEDIGGARKKAGTSKVEGRAGKSDLPAKFKGPEGQLWSGMGRHPGWYREALANGKKADEFRI